MIKKTLYFGNPAYLSLRMGQMVIKLPEVETDSNLSDQIKKQAAKHSYQGIEEIIKALDTAKVRLNANVNFDLTIELLLLTIKEN